MNQMHIFVDGSCSGNNSVFAERKAGIGMFYTSQFNRKGIHEEHDMLLPTEYIYSDNAIQPISEKMGSIKVTNNRAELLAIARSLTFIITNDIDKDTEIKIFSDNEVAVKTINEWFPSRLKYKTEKQMANYDLVSMCYNLFKDATAKYKNINLTHVYGHQKENPTNSPESNFLIYGNNIADMLSRKSYLK